jgi:hypothetical protein
VDASPTQVYRDEHGVLWLFVRHEEREHEGEGILWVGVSGDIVVSRFTQLGTETPGELVNDTAARQEAFTWRLLQEQAEQERDVLIDVMKEAVKLLAPSQVEDMRRLYDRRIGSCVASSLASKP